jgi:uncharacterized membrane protein
MVKTDFQESQSEPFGQPSSRLLPREGEYQKTTGYGDSRRSRSDWSRGEANDDGEERLARGLGWFSIGLGITQIAAPRAFARLVGLNDNRGLMRMVGIREIASGVGILSRRKPTGWLWSRVGGDLMDLTILGTALVSPSTNRRRVATATAAVTGVTVLDIRASQELSSSPAPEDNRISIRVRKSITINRPAEELYGFWRDFQNLARFMKHVESVQVTGDKRSHWVAKGPAGKRVEWDAETIEDRPNELIAWRSIEGSTVENSGSVRFEPATGGRGTVVRVELEYYPPAGLLGATVAKLLGEEPKGQLAEDLRRFKQLMEAGEIITTEGQPAGRAKSTSWKYDHAGRRLASAF